MYGAAIIAQLGLDTRHFKSGLQSALGSASSFGTKMAGVLGASVSIAGLEQFVSKVVAYGDKIQDLSDRYGVNAEALQKLGNIAETQGSSLEGVAKGFNKLLINSSQALSGNKEMIESFSALGVSVGDLRRLSPEEIMVKIGKSSMDAADLVKVLGKSALELRPTLDGLAKGTLKYGDAISAVDIEKLDRAADLWKKLWQAILIGGSDVLITSVDAVKVASENLINIAQTMLGAWGNVFKGMEAAARLDLAGVKEAAKLLYQTKIELSGLDKRDENRPRPRTFTDGESSDNAAKSDRRQVLQKLAERPKKFGNDQTIQEWWAGEEARKELAGEVQGRPPAVRDRAAALPMLDRVNGMRQGVGSLPPQGGGAGDFAKAMDTTTMAKDIAVIKSQLDMSGIGDI